MDNTEKGRPRDLGPEQVRLMQGLAQEVTIRRPQVLEGGATVGELAWQFGKDRAAIGDRWRYRLWPRADGSGRLDAWAWVYLPYTVRLTDGSTATSTSADLIWQVHPNRPDLLDEVLDWYAAQAAGLDQFITPQDADTELLARLAARGYTRDAEAGGDDGHWHQFNRRPLVNLAEPVLPGGFRFRTAAEVGSAAATRAHVDAWYPSTFTETSMAGVQSMWPYRDDLHVLIEAPDGTLVATAIIWFDPVTRTAEFEPVGTHRAHRRQGLATALLWHGMHRARDAGAETMLVACVGAAGRPAARELYYGVGFEPFARDVPHVKRAP
ncbi:MAG: GNAT family N-acetyltransferase [Firmicutes bacterium]|nr:GNAT family N-acetyltransferase [Bacillota bacterium]